jgi:hypothetical protein
MANDDIFTATVVWQAVEANGEELSNGTFSVVNMQVRRVDFLKSDVLPSPATKGSSFMKNRQDSNKYTLEGSERLFAKAGSRDALLGIIRA